MLCAYPFSSGLPQSVRSPVSAMTLTWNWSAMAPITWYDVGFRCRSVMCSARIVFGSGWKTGSDEMFV